MSALGPRNFRQQCGDQALHILMAVGILGPYALFPTVWGAMASGFILGAVREVEQYFRQDARDLILTDRVVDVAFAVIGALILHAVLNP